VTFSRNLCRVRVIHREIDNRQITITLDPQPECFLRSEGENMMHPRLELDKVAPDALKAVLQVSAYINNHSGLEPTLLHLVYLRASQINGCAWCIDMHTKDARALGETEQRLYQVSAWWDAPFYSDRDRAALAWTEAVTRIEGRVSDEVYEEAKKHFTAKELVNLTLAITQINVWNRFNVAFRNVAGSYQPNVRELKKSA
jgi:AhpD family alkylhydroperoxidase